MLRIAVVILNWNGKGHLEKYLPYAIQFTTNLNSELIVADNGSTDGSVSFLEQYYPTIKIIKLDENHGFAGGYNLALEQVDADLFCLLNSDVRVTEGWLDPVIELFSSDEKIAAIQPKILSDRDCTKFEHAGAAGGFIDKYGYPFCRGRIMNVIEKDNGQYDQVTDIFWASGACLFIRAGIFKESGGFDSNFFAHMEEIDLCWRLKNQGYRIVYTPKSKVYHYGGATLDYDNPRKLFLNFRNSLWTLYKNYTGNHLRLRMISRMMIDTIALLKYFVSFNFVDAWSITKAHLAYYRSKPELKHKRKLLQAKTIRKSHPEMLEKSIVWQFFFYSRRTFNMYKSFRSLLN